MVTLVTGGAGFVGTNIIRNLLKKDKEVYSLDNYSSGRKSNEQDGCYYYNVDLSRFTNFDKFHSRPSIIYHMAALARIQPSITNPVHTIKNNFDSTLNIIEWARKLEIPVVFAGSSSYHHGLWGSPYAWSKFGGEQLCKLYSTVYNLKTATCRFYNVYGPNQLEDGAYATVIGIFEKQYREGNPLTVTGDGNQRRDFTHINDIVNGILKCGEALLNDDDNNISGETFELGSGVNHSINEIVDYFGSKKKYIPKRLGEYDVTLCDYSKAASLLNYKPHKSLIDYIKEKINHNQ